MANINQHTYIDWESPEYPWIVEYVNMQCKDKDISEDPTTFRWEEYQRYWTREDARQVKRMVEKKGNKARIRRCWVEKKIYS